MTVRQAREWFKNNYDATRESFYADHTAPTGGLLNPSVVDVVDGDVEIRCHYDNYSGDEDAWTWFLDPDTLQFYN